MQNSDSEVCCGGEAVSDGSYGCALQVHYTNSFGRSAVLDGGEADRNSSRFTARSRMVGLVVDAADLPRRRFSPIGSC